MSQVIATVERLKTFFGIDCTVQTKPFNSYKELKKTSRGVYVLTSQDGLIIYVGKGTIKDRQDSHWFKAHGTPKKHQIDPKGWKWLRENYTITPGAWTINYIELKRETELSAMEGGLIHILQPLANDETFKDEGRTLKED
jgi:ligand-binding sensor domain-containing protein